MGLQDDGTKKPSLYFMHGKNICCNTYVAIQAAASNSEEIENMSAC
jgi:hypothetical protein